MPLPVDAQNIFYILVITLSVLSYRVIVHKQPKTLKYQPWTSMNEITPYEQYF